MPSRPMHPCPKHGGVLVGAGQECPRCILEPVQILAEKDKQPSVYKPEYGREHRQKRRELLKRSPYCMDPYHRHPTIRKPAVIRDHKVPLAAGGTDDESNEQGLCQSCHNYKMYRDGSRSRGKKSFDRGASTNTRRCDRSWSPRCTRSETPRLRPRGESGRAGAPPARR